MKRLLGNPALPAFTVIELLVVVAVIGILAALLLPVLTRARESGKSAACLSNLRQVGVALQLYVDDNNNTMPRMFDGVLSTNAVPESNAVATIDVVLTNYLGNPRILRCPSDNQQLYEKTGASYAWNFLLNGQDAGQLKVFNVPYNADEIPVVFDKEAFHRARSVARGVNFLYADGHIKNLLAIEGTKK